MPLNLFSKKNNDKVVIFIHGLANKPPKKLLKKWYLKAIREGLIRHKNDLKNFNFEVVYWADLLYSKPMDPNIKKKDHPLYLDEPYEESLLREYDNRWQAYKQKAYDKLENFVDGFFLSKDSWINVEYIFDQIASRAFKDLHAYYRKNVGLSKKPEETAKRNIRLRLKNTLLKYRDKEVFLISHSMGSIVAYDVLLSSPDECQVNTLVTIGSPLGLSMIKREIFNELGHEYEVQTKLPTPENVCNAWYNLADLDDNVAINYNLSDDYAENSKGVGPNDMIVYNDYEFEGEKNPHKSYGYLRTKEMAHFLWEFLEEKKTTLVEKIKDLGKEILDDLD